MVQKEGELDSEGPLKADGACVSVHVCTHVCKQAGTSVGVCL